MEKACCICNQDLTGVDELSRLVHIDQCLDLELEKKLERIEDCNTQKREEPVIKVREENVQYDFTGMLDYDHMSAAELKKHLDEYGMKKSLDVKLARVVLKETWLYINQGIMPQFMNKYL